MGKILRSWKEIAAKLGTSVRTAQRWERQFELPVRRTGTKKGSVVFAFEADLSSWLRAKNFKAGTALRSELFRELFVKYPFPTIVVDDARRIIEANDAACELVLMDRQRIVGQPAQWFALGASPVQAESRWRDFLDVGSGSGFGLLHLESGSSIAVRYTLTTFQSGLNAITMQVISEGEGLTITQAALNQDVERFSPGST